MANHDVPLDNLTSNHTTKIKEGDTITWNSQKSDNWLVIFLTESPFSECFFHKHNKKSNPVGVKANPLKTYKYSVYFQSGLHVDPNVVIE